MVLRFLFGPEERAHVEDDRPPPHNLARVRKGTGTGAELDIREATLEHRAFTADEKSFHEAAVLHDRAEWTYRDAHRLEHELRE